MQQPSERARDKLRQLQKQAERLILQLGLSTEDAEHVLASRLFRGEEAGTEQSWTIEPYLVPTDLEARLSVAHELGTRLDQLHREDQVALTRAGAQGSVPARKSAGSFFTPQELTRRLIGRSHPALVALGKSASQITTLDPAVGGGAFLLEAARLLLGIDRFRKGWLARFIGADRSEVALAVADAALRLAFGAKAGAPTLILADSLQDDICLPEPPDWVVSNPPWVAYQGRAAVPLTPLKRRFYRERYQAFHGYPTLQGMFVQRSAELAPDGVITLLLPSSLADLDGYQNARAALTAHHRPLEPLEEYGQDAFLNVVQPCFGLIAEPHSLSSDPAARSQAPSCRPWRLLERQRKGDAGEASVAPLCLETLRNGPSLPPEIFGELGFQSNRIVTAELLSRQDHTAESWIPLLEGKNIHEFSVKPPRLWLDPRPAELARARVRLRPPEAYARVAFVVRQTASYPIAAPHSGHAFRNSLLAGYVSADLSRDLLLGLLNSTLYRAIFLSMTRDARQAVFPQIKVGALRRLPLPPHSPSLRAQVASVARQWTENQGSNNAELRRELDQAVGNLFELSAEHRAEVSQFFAQRTTKAKPRT